MTDKLEPHPYYGHLSKEHAEHLEAEIKWLREFYALKRKRMDDERRLYAHIVELEDQLHNTGDKSIQI